MSSSVPSFSGSPLATVTRPRSSHSIAKGRAYTGRLRPLFSLLLPLAACGDQGEPASPLSRPSSGSAPPPVDVSSVEERDLVREPPPIDVVSTHGAIAAWPYVVPGVLARAITSHDRSGGNDDGFGGTYSRLYERNGEHVIFDAFGPGVLRTLWFTSAVDGNGPLGIGMVRFYLDDEPNPRFALDANALFTGDHAPFVAPLVADNQETSGGYASWASIVYRHRLVITTERRAGFYQAFYDTLPPDWDVASTAAGSSSVDLASRFAATDFSTLALEEVPLDVTRSGEGTIDVLRFEPEGAVSTSDLSAARIRIWFDGAVDPQVDLPLGTFFGSGLGEATVRAVPWTMTTGRYESRFPMPYFEGVRIAVSGLSGKLLLHVAPPLAPRHAVATFTAIHAEEHPTTPGQDFLYADVTGSGKLVGTVLTILPLAPSAKQWWEGDLRSFVDGLATPAVHGTGHEDDHLGGWSNEFLERPFTQPM